jgi:MoaA/NifB/PqqE/SkfB family radical SAM enzyme
MSETTPIYRLAEKIFGRVRESINQSQHNFIWKQRAIAKARKIFQDQNIDINALVEYLINEEIKTSPQKLHMASVEHRALLMKALYGTILNRVNGGQISEDVVMKIIDDRWGNDFFQRITSSENSYFDQYDRFPPGFVLISPSQHCNLSCEGCYASSTSRTKNHLAYDVVKRIIEESHEQWGARSVAISGGEPLMYRSDGKSIIHLARELPYMYFKIYTNGTLISESVAEEMASLANITPAISIEGTYIDTDNRRGDGVYDKVMSAMRNLREAGVPYGVSITATTNNIHTLLDESFYDYLFDELKITYGWIFEYMPIGRGVDTELMPSPLQRKQLFELLDIQNRDGRFMCDFWSTSPSAEGCLAAGRSYGYLYINWNGDVIPCVFNPYTDTNIHDVFSAGGTLTSAIEDSTLFKSLRQWQYDYGFRQGNNVGNFMAPCPIRDHYKDYRNMLIDTQATPVDEAAGIALTDPDYFRKMVEYGEEVERQLKPVWDQRFCGRC